LIARPAPGLGVKRIIPIQRLQAFGIVVELVLGALVIMKYRVGYIGHGERRKWEFINQSTWYGKW
jgi:hypothetical protein